MNPLTALSRASIAATGVLAAGVLLAAGIHDKSTDKELVARYLKYRDLTKLNGQQLDMTAAAAQRCAIDAIVAHGPHFKPGINLYANDKVVATRRKDGAARYPVGALLVKEKFSNKNGTKPELITVMEKTADTGAVSDWKFTMIRLSDKSLVPEDERRSCIECHTAYKGNDFVSPQTTAVLKAFVAKQAAPGK